MLLFFSYISAAFDYTVFCNTNECDGDRGFLRADSNGVRNSSAAPGVDPSIITVACLFRAVVIFMSVHLPKHAC